MTNQQKQEIHTALITYLTRFESQAKAVSTLKNVSEATIINMKNGKWDSIRPEMWRNVAKQICPDGNFNKAVETMDFNTLILYFTLAREEGVTFAITGPAGYGKTFTSQWYANNMKGKNVYYLQCAEYWSKKDFLRELLKAMGLPHTGMNMYEMMECIIAELLRQEHPLIIWDEIDKLKDAVLLFFITIYNRVNGICGNVWVSTNTISRRIERGMERNRPGYEEIYRRIGRRFIKLIGTNKDEVEALCNAKDITAAEDINRIYNEYSGDISRIDREYYKKIATDRLAGLRLKGAQSGLK